MDGSEVYVIVAFPSHIRLLFDRASLIVHPKDLLQPTNRAQTLCIALLYVPKGHRPVNVKRALIGSKGGWKLSTIFLSCKVFHDWSIIKLGNILYLLDGYIFAVLFETTSHCFC